MAMKKFILSDNFIQHRKDLSIAGKHNRKRNLMLLFHLKYFLFRDSFKRSFKRSGSISRRSSIRANLNVAVNDTIPSQEHDVTDPSLVIKDTHTSTNSLTNSARVNFNGLLDSHFIDNSPLPSSINLQDQNENDDDDSLVEHIQTEDGRVQEIHVYQVYLLGMSGTGKYSLMRQFKTTEYRGTYEYSSSIGKCTCILLSRRKIEN